MHENLGKYLKNYGASDRKKVSTFPLIDFPIGRGLTVTVPFRPSSRSLAEIVVLMRTPSLLKIYI